MVAVVAVGGVTRVVGDQFELRTQRVDLPDVIGGRRQGIPAHVLAVAAVALSLSECGARQCRHVGTALCVFDVEACGVLRRRVENRGETSAPVVCTALRIAPAGEGQPLPGLFAGLREAAFGNRSEASRPRGGECPAPRADADAPRGGIACYPVALHRGELQVAVHAALASAPQCDEDHAAPAVGGELGARQRYHFDAGDVGCGQAAQVGDGFLRRTFQLAAVHVDFRTAGAVDRDAVLTQPYARRPCQQFGAVLSRECGRIPDADHEPVGLPRHRLGGHRHLADSERCKG